MKERKFDGMDWEKVEKVIVDSGGSAISKNYLQNIQNACTVSHLNWENQYIGSQKGDQMVNWKILIITKIKKTDKYNTKH